MKKHGAEPRREIDFSRTRRGPVVKAEAGKTKISIRLDNAILDFFRREVERAGGGNYQSLINDALRMHIERSSLADTLREIVKQEIAGPLDRLRTSIAPQAKRPRKAA
jgi:uncharacterized protein (DUF4415 family)